MLIKPVTRNALNIYLIFGIKANGTLKADRYNIIKSSSWESKECEKICSDIEKATKLTIATYTINAENTKNSKQNEVRAIININNFSIPVRFKPEE